MVPVLHEFPVPPYNLSKQFGLLSDLVIENFPQRPAQNTDVMMSGQICFISIREFLSYLPSKIQYSTGVDLKMEGFLFPEDNSESTGGFID